MSEDTIELMRPEMSWVYRIPIIGPDLCAYHFTQSLWDAWGDCVAMKHVRIDSDNETEQSGNAIGANLFFYENSKASDEMPSDAV